MRSTRLVTDYAMLKHNIEELKKGLSPETHIMAVVKANAYGHGVLAIARASVLFGVDWLGVATPEEGVYLRQNGVTTSILVLGAANSDELKLSVDYSLHQSVFDAAQITELNTIAEKAGTKAFVHIKINSGMNRIGISDENVFDDVLSALDGAESVVADGIFTHFATADEEDQSGTKLQLARFQKFLDAAKSRGRSFKFVHAANTAATLSGVCPEMNLVRIGIGIYGYYPSEYSEKTSTAELLPIAKFITNISAINRIAMGEAVSYGGIFKAERDSVIATLPVGYADGYNRKLSNGGTVVIRGKRAPIVGRICMDQMMVDITDINGVKVGDEVLLMGMSGIADIDADDIANRIGTVSYEVLTSISRRVERVYINSEKQ